MKKFLSLILSVLVITLSTPKVCFAAVYDQFTVGDLTYTVLTDDDESKTVSVKAKDTNISGDITIPNSVENDNKSYTVTSIENSAFSNCFNLYSIEIPNGVTEIRAAAFRGCTKLSSIEIPSSVQSIHNRAFFLCSCLNSIEIPSSVNTIGEKAFLRCNSLNSITISCDFDKTKFASSSINPKSNSDKYELLDDFGNYLAAGTFEYVHNLRYEDTGNGTHTGTCQNENCCKSDGDQAYAETESHDMGDWETTKEPTCTEPGTQTSSCKKCNYTEPQTLPALGHKYIETVIAPTDTTLGGTHHVCSRCGDEYWTDFTKDDTYAQTIMPNGETIYHYCTHNDLAAETTVDVGDGQTLKVFLQDPLRVLKKNDTDVLDIAVTYVPDGSARYNELKNQVDDTHPIEHIKFFNVNPTVNGVPKTGALDGSIYMEYEIPEGWDEKDLEMILVQDGDDQEFDETVLDIDSNRYLAMWKNHFSPYAMIDKLSEEEQAALNIDKLNDEQKAQLNTALENLSDEELAQLKEEIDSSSNQVKTGDETGYIVLMSSAMLIIAGLYLEICLINRKINII